MTSVSGEGLHFAIKCGCYHKKNRRMKKKYSIYYSITVTYSITVDSLLFYAHVRHPFSLRGFPQYKTFQLLLFIAYCI